MEQVTASLTADAPELMNTIGLVAGRLLENMPEGSADSDMRRKALLERALMCAAQAEQHSASRAERIKYLQNLSFTDEVTGLFNRRGFDEQLRRTLANARRFGHTGLMAYHDLDGFKTVKDCYGHRGGDAVLRYVGEIAIASLRERDTVARLCGDEFAMLLTRTTKAYGAKRARSLQ